jgi:hypothetical protein
MVAVAVAATLVGCVANRPLKTTITRVDGFTVSTVWDGMNIPESTVNNVPVPGDAVTGSAVFSGVACASTGPCFAAGNAEYASDQSRNVPLLESLTGSRWAVASAPFPGRFGEWDQISCAGTFCAALGSIGSSSDHPSPVADVLQDGSWHSTRVPKLPRGVTDFIDLSWLSCGTDHICVAGINAFTAAGTNVPEVLVLTDGAWTIGALPVPANRKRPLLDPGVTAVECSSVHTCVLLGSDGNGDVLDVLSDGKWTSTESATTNYYDATCNSASCVVFTAPPPETRYSAGAVSHLLVVTGTAPPKEQVPFSPSPELDDLNCPTSTWCASSLVGTGSVTSGDQLGIESNGGWKTVQAAPPGRYAQLLSPIQCESADVCVAAGASARSSGATRFALPLIDTLNHGRWLPTTIALPAGMASDGGTITSIACSLALTCVALGSVGDNLGP